MRAISGARQDGVQIVGPAGKRDDIDGRFIFSGREAGRTEARERRARVSASSTTGTSFPALARARRRQPAGPPPMIATVRLTASDSLLCARACSASAPSARAYRRSRMTAATLTTSAISSGDARVGARRGVMRRCSTAPGSHTRPRARPSSWSSHRPRRLPSSGRTTSRTPPTAWGALLAMSPETREVFRGSSQPWARATEVSRPGPGSAGDEVGAAGCLRIDGAEVAAAHLGADLQRTVANSSGRSKTESSSLSG